MTPELFNLAKPPFENASNDFLLFIKYTGENKIKMFNVYFKL